MRALAQDESDSRQLALVGKGCEQCLPLAVCTEADLTPKQVTSPNFTLVVITYNWELRDRLEGLRGLYGRFFLAVLSSAMGPTGTKSLRFSNTPEAESCHCFLRSELEATVTKVWTSPTFSPIVFLCEEKKNTLIKAMVFSNALGLQRLFWE